MIHENAKKVNSIIALFCFSAIFAPRLARISAANTFSLIFRLFLHRYIPKNAHGFLLMVCFFVKIPHFLLYFFFFVLYC